MSDPVQLDPVQLDPVRRPPRELLERVGPDAVATHRRGLGRGAWVIVAQGGRTAVAAQCSATAAAATRVAGALSVGPVVLGVADGWVLTERLTGTRLTPVELSRPAVLRELVALLATWHSAPSATFERELTHADLMASLHAYSAAAGALDDRVLAAVDWAELALDRLSAVSPRPVPCHLDVAANVMATPRGLRLIDYDFAALADPAQELGQLIWEAELDERSATQLVDVYASGTSGASPVSVAAAATWCVAVGICWTVWGLAAADPVMARYARRSWERLATHWAWPERSICG